MFFNLNGTYRLAGPVLMPGLAWKCVTASIAAGDSYTPDLRQAVEFDIDITSPGAVTINNPIPFLPVVDFAQLLVTHLRNRSGGAITVTWGSKYRQPAAFPDPTNGNGTICLWHYDDPQDVWYNSTRQVVPN